MGDIDVTQNFVNLNLLTIFVKKNKPMDKQVLEDLLINQQNLDYMCKEQKVNFNLSKLLRTTLTQTQSIRFGNLFQEFVGNILKLVYPDISIQLNEILDIDQKDDNIEIEKSKKSKKGKKEADLICTLNPKMYYFEIKTSLNLDSEKYKETIKKLENILAFLKNKFPNHDVHSYVLSCWWKKEKGMPIKVKDAMFMGEFCELFNIPITEEEYYDIFAKFGQKLKENSCQ